MRYFICGIFLTCALAAVSAAAPKPAVIPESADWTVDVSFENPQQLSLSLPDGAAAKRFWYVIITITNNTGRDIDFYPKCELMTDTLQIIPAGSGTPDVVFENIKASFSGKYPFLELLGKCGNRILQGRDNAKDIAIIWPDFDPKTSCIDIFITGLSSETAAVDHPVEKDQSGKPVKVYLRKTLQLTYTLTGDANLRSGETLSFKSKNWVMR